MTYDGIIECEECGARYKIFKQSIPIRDKDSIECHKCRAELKRWNGGVMYRVELISED